MTKKLMIIQTISTAILLSLFISCGQDNIKQKELELKEKELKLRERELVIKEKETLNSKASDINKSQPTVEINSKKPTDNNEIGLDNFLGCWFWGDNPNEAFAILEIKPKGILIVHRLDLGEYGTFDEKASYKIVGSKIKFKSHLLIENDYHIEHKSQDVFLVEEYPGTPNKFKKIRCR